MNVTKLDEPWGTEGTTPLQKIAQAQEAAAASSEQTGADSVLRNIGMPTHACANRDELVVFAPFELREGEVEFTETVAFSFLQQVATSARLSFVSSWLEVSEFAERYALPCEACGGAEYRAVALDGCIDWMERTTTGSLRIDSWEDYSSRTEEPAVLAWGSACP